MSIELRPFTTEAEMKAYLEFATNDYGYAMYQAGEYPTLEVSQQAAANEVFSFYNTPRPGKAHYPFHVYSREEEAIVGMAEMVTVERWGLLVGFVNFIYIQPEHRRKGYAMEAMTLMENEVRKLNLNVIDLNVLIHRTGPQAMYKRLGYEVKRRWIGGYAQHITRVDMRKTLS
jgi:ribosomal protein S18 acetylase RimI-like enzyme